MKKYFYFLLVLFFVSCNNSTEQKLINAVEGIEKQEAKKNGQPVEYIKVDSLTYSLVSLADYYRDKHNILKQEFNNKYELLDKLYLNQKLINDNSDTLKNYLTKKDTELKTIKTTDSLINVSDATGNIYKVNYILDIKTGQNSYEERKTAYLYTSTLEKVKK